jgi:hypothetical protein
MAISAAAGKGRAHAAECNGAEVGAQAVESASTGANGIAHHKDQGQQDGAGSRPRHHKNSADDRSWATNGYSCHDMLNAAGGTGHPVATKPSAAAAAELEGLPNGSSSSSKSRRQCEAKEGQSRRQSKGRDYAFSLHKQVSSLLLHSLY